MCQNRASEHENRNRTCLVCHNCHAAFNRRELPLDVLNCLALVVYFFARDFMNAARECSHAGMVLPARYS